MALPRFGEWDLRNPGAGEFSVIFEKARNAKKEGRRHKFDPDSPIFKKDPEEINPFADPRYNVHPYHKRRRWYNLRRWFCCCVRS